MSSPEHSIATLVAGLVFLTAGIAFGLQELGLLTVGWTLLLPALLVALGLVTLVAGLGAARRSNTTP